MKRDTSLCGGKIKTLETEFAMQLVEHEKTVEKLKSEKYKHEKEMKEKISELEESEVTITKLSKLVAKHTN